MGSWNEVPAGGCKEAPINVSVRHKRLVQEEERANASRDEEQQRELPLSRVMGVWQRKST